MPLCVGVYLRTSGSLPRCAPLVPPVQLVGILRASVPLFKDMSSFKDFKNQVEDLVHKLDAYQKDQFQV